jgi:hypothetical protein
MTAPNGSPPLAKRFADFARQHPGLLLTGGYLAATAVGMLSSWTFYGRLGVNIFHYAQLSDFILVALRNPLATVAILAAFPAVWVVMKSDAWMDRRFRWYGLLYGSDRLRQWSRAPSAWALYLTLYAVAFSIVYSGRMVTRVHAGEVRFVEAQLQSGDYLGRDATTPFRSGLLGTTSAYVFLYDVASRTVTVVPLENLARLTLE